MFRYERRKRDGCVSSTRRAELLGVADPIGDVKSLRLARRFSTRWTSRVISRWSSTRSVIPKPHYRMPCYLFQRPPVRFVVGRRTGWNAIRCNPRFQKQEIARSCPARPNSMTAWIRSHAISLPKCAQALTRHISWTRNSRLLAARLLLPHRVRITTNALGAQRAVRPAVVMTGWSNRRPVDTRCRLASGPNACLVGGGPAKTRPIAIILWVMQQRRFPY